MGDNATYEIAPNGGLSKNCAVVLGDSADPPPMYGATVRYIISVFLTVIPVISMCGNGLVIMAVLTHRKLRTLTNTFVVSLAFADCLVAVLVMPFGIYQQFNNGEWFLGDTACFFTTSLDVMFTTTSILHLSCLAFDRYLAICNPFFYSESINKKTVSLMLGGCWIIPMFISFLPILNRWHLYGIEDFYYCIAPSGSHICYFVVNIAFSLICSLIAFYIPTVFLVACYYKIYKAALTQAKLIRQLDITVHNHNNTGQGHNHHKARVFRQETKAAKTLGIIMGVFCCCWFPFFIFNVIDPLITYRIHYIPWTVALWLGYVNSMINPFLYGFFNRSFKRAFLRIFRLRICIKGLDYEESAMTGASQVSD